MIDFGKCHQDIDIDINGILKSISVFTIYKKRKTCSQYCQIPHGLPHVLKVWERYYSENDAAETIDGIPYMDGNKVLCGHGCQMG